MTDENKIETVEVKHECFCQSKGFRKFLIVALGSFVGVFCALSLFAALHRPPMMPPCPCAAGPMPRHALQCPCKCDHHNFDRHRGPRGDFYQDKPMMKDRIAPDRVRVDVKG